MARKQHKAINWSQLPEGLHRDREAAEQGIRGLYLQVGAPAPLTGTQARSWVLRYMIAGKARALGLGPFPAISVEAARGKAQEARTQLAQDVDPLEAKRQRVATAAAEAKAAEIAAITFKQVATDYIADSKNQWRNEKHRQQWTNTLTTYAYPTLGHLAPIDITTDDVAKVLRPIWTTKRETADRLRGRIERILDAAPGMPEGKRNAADLKDVRKKLPQRKKQKVKHHRAIDYRDLPALYAQLTAMNTESAAALRFTILTAARTGEVIYAEAREFNPKAGIWTIPEGRMKGEREHRVPLSPAAAEIIQPRLSAAQPFAMSNAAMLELLKRMKVDGTPHGMRTCFSSWCADHGVDKELREMALSHVIENETEAAYQRSDMFKRRQQLMDEWAAFVTSKC